MADMPQCLLHGAIIPFICPTCMVKGISCLEHAAGHVHPKVNLRRVPRELCHHSSVGPDTVEALLRGAHKLKETHIQSSSSISVHLELLYYLQFLIS